MLNGIGQEPSEVVVLVVVVSEGGPNPFRSQGGNERAYSTIYTPLYINTQSQFSAITIKHAFY